MGMKMETWTWAGVSCGAVLLALATPALIISCSKSSVPPPPTETGGACSAEAGAFPTANCDNTPETCTAPNPACPVAPCNASSPCLAMADNSGAAVDDLRMRMLNVAAPPALATQYIQANVINSGIDLQDLCGEPGTGSFSWLIEFNPTTKQLTTGGAPPSSDPFNVGYCFVNANVGGLQVAPITVNMTQGSDGTWSSDVIPKLNVPIYINGSSTDVVVLPISQSKVIDVTLSPDGNCIGSYNPDAVQSPSTTQNTCADFDDSVCQRWHTAGSLGGYITLKEADGVQVQVLGKSLCVLLTNGVATTNGGANCATDSNGNIEAKGDFCSTTDSPGGCQDSYWLAATFAASAAKITAGTDVPQCNGSQLDGGATDSGGGGGDAGAPGDAGGGG